MRSPASLFKGGWRHYSGVALFLILLILLTWAGRTWRVAHIQDTASERREEAVEAAFRHIESDFERLQHALVGRARRLARTPAVIEGLQRYAERQRPTAPEELVDHFAALQVPERWSAELYDPTPRLIAWQGYSMPLDPAPNAPRFLQSFQTAVANDGPQRQAIVVWQPVHQNGRVLGIVRLMRLTRSQVPVENQYLQHYSLVDDWQQATGLPVSVRYGVDADSTQLQGRIRPLRGIDGTQLGYVAIEPPSARLLVQNARQRFNDVLAFWGTLLLLWLLIGLWHWYRRSLSFTHDATVHRQLGRATGRCAVIALAWWCTRYVLLTLNVPARWQLADAPLAPLFDPHHLAYTFGAGLMRSTGDFLLTALFALAFGIALLNLARRFQRKSYTLHRLRKRRPEAGSHPSPLRFIGTSLAAGLVAFGLVELLAAFTRYALLYSTLDYFAQESLLPSPLVLIVFVTLLLLTAAVMAVFVSVGWIAIWLLLRYRPAHWRPELTAAAALLIAAVPIVLLSILLHRPAIPGPVVTGAFLVTALLLTLGGLTRHRRALQLLELRNLLLVLFLLTVLLYPLLDKGRAVQRRTQMTYAAELFSQGQDPRVAFAMRQVLDKAQERLPELLPAEQYTADSVATELLRGSLLSSLSLYDVSLTLFDSSGTPQGRSFQPAPRPGRTQLNRVDSAEFSILRQIYNEMSASGAMVERITGRRERDRFQYIGVIPFPPSTSDALEGWAMVRAEPQSLLHDGSTPFPRVLLPAGLYGNPYASLSLAEFSDGTLTRSFGHDFGRYRLSPEVQRTLLSRPETWRLEQIEDREFLTYYRRPAQETEAESLPPTSDGLSIIAVRTPAVSLFNHLYYLLRLTTASIILGVVGYLVGLYLRWQAGLLPAKRIRFRDKILNAFLGVGLVTVAAVGFVGLQVVQDENERSLQSWLRQYLERVEKTLLLEATGAEMPYRVVDRMRVDSLSSRVGLDLNLYTAERLVASSRPQFVREDLIDERLPMEAVKALYYDGYRFTYTREQVGSFTYTTGFRTLLDEQGRPRYVVAVPTLPEQERIEEERVRTIAYLFGALLLLVLVVMMTASLIAQALTRPLARLREGLEAVARGRFERPLPVTSRDEIGELVETFNSMQEQLAESRRKLARQERELAWREMARQVAHEIKNPLTPMKLSLQHLRRAYDRLDLSSATDNASVRRFQEQLERITSTVIEQIDALARIANEFHSFARMPTRTPERLDLNAVIREAASLMQEEAQTEIEQQLHAEALPVTADREELRRIYINLLKNAIQAIPDDRTGRIKVITSREHHDGRTWAVSTVSDNGTGIPREVREKIFQPNFSTKTSGTGLGLAIIKKGLNDLNGEIDFETEEGKGTTFRIHIPLTDD